MDTESFTATRDARRRLAVRCRKANGQWGVGVLISTLAPTEVLALTQQSAVSSSDPASVRTWKMSMRGAPDIVSDSTSILTSSAP